MSGSAFAVTHHAFSSGAGRTSGGNGSHASTLKSPSYTKSVSWQHYLSVDGVQFEVYRKILDAFEIKWVARTDNDSSKVPKKKEWQYSGLNRALVLCGMKTIKNELMEISQVQRIEKHKVYKDALKCNNIF
ncbi:TPA: hypothetical protein ACHWLI_003151, partial [Enterobacter sichuanensis]